MPLGTSFLRMRKEAKNAFFRGYYPLETAVKGFANLRFAPQTTFSFIKLLNFHLCRAFRLLMQNEFMKT